MDAQPEAEAALKLHNLDRFIPIPLIVTSGVPWPHPKWEDQTIGIWYYDKSGTICRRHGHVCRYKQDFVVNIKTKHEEFVVYSADRDNPPYVKPIKIFFKEYGEDGKYYHKSMAGISTWEHHYKDIDALPNEPRLRSIAKLIEDRIVI
jgi:hypothetical protein